MDGGAWWARVNRVAKSRTRLSDEHFHFQPQLYVYFRVAYFLLRSFLEYDELVLVIVFPQEYFLFHLASLPGTSAFNIEMLSLVLFLSSSDCTDLCLFLLLTVRVS